nr:MAG TPA: hypothetical protein [Caudoviricetes sp.]
MLSVIYIYILSYILKPNVSSKCLVLILSTSTKC